MQTALPIACFLSAIRPPSIQFENSVLTAYPVNKDKCPFVHDEVDVNFLLYTKHNPNEPQLLRIDDDEALFASNMDFNDNTAMLFHAFFETPDEGSAILIREALLQRQHTNVIMVDARGLEAGPWYFTAATNTWYIGRVAAQLTDYLVSRGLKLSKTHYIGHSLGAQSAGVAGYYLKSGKVSRITGLDPAKPLFENAPLEQRLDASDAEFVDVIHTDAGIFGTKRQLGHVEFFPNGGISPQPGCELEVVLPHKTEIFNIFFCSHWRSYRFFSESILRPNAFVASQCPSWKDYKQGKCAGAKTTHMGYGVDRNARGTYYVMTHAKPPFSIE